MTQNTYTRIQFQNAIAYRDQHAQEVADAAELVTPFTVIPGTPIFDVTIRKSTEPDELIMVLGLLGGSIEQRIMPKREYTYQLAQAYAANAHIKTVGIN
jgi:hypothetical protein